MPPLLTQGAGVLRAINHPLRQRILRLQHKNERLSVTAIYRKLKLVQAVASQHLAILRQANLVITERDGQRIFYSVNYRRLQRIHKVSEGLTLHLRPNATCRDRVYATTVMRHIESFRWDDKDYCAVWHKQCKGNVQKVDFFYFVDYARSNDSWSDRLRPGRVCGSRF